MQAIDENARFGCDKPLLKDLQFPSQADVTSTADEQSDLDIGKKVAKTYDLDSDEPARVLQTASTIVLDLVNFSRRSCTRGGNMSLAAHCCDLVPLKQAV